MPLTVTTLVLIASPLISLAALAVTCYLYRRTQRASIMPVLVFARIAERQWQMVNVGQGPALSIVVGDKAQGDKWGFKVRCFPIAAGAKVDLPWLQHGDQLVAVYTDIRGRAYSSVCGMSENRLYQSNKFLDLTPTLDEVSVRALQEEYRRKL